jgi:hypothetical protein
MFQWFIFILLILVSACSEKNLISPKSPDSKTPQGIFAIQEGKALLRSDAIGQEFLLRSWNFTSDHQSGEAHRARRVRFQKGPQGLALMESSEGHSTSAEFAQNLLIASFENPGVQGNYWVLDLNRAFNKLFVGSDFQESTKDYHIENHTLALPFISSFLSQLELPKPETLFWEQRVQMQENTFKAKNPKEMVHEKSVFETTYVKFSLTLVKEDRNFAVTKRIPGKHKYFFSTETFRAPKTRESYSLLVKRSLEQPVVYAISANTPEKYVGPIKEGVLYWNKASGRELVKVVKLTSPLPVWDMDTNLIEWMEDEGAGAAYTNFDADPKTGKILGSSIYLPSVWVKEGLIRGHWHRVNGKSKKTSVCHYEFPGGFLESEMESNGPMTPAQREAALIPILRNTVAHEVGHSLGLRHNFAASFSTEFPLEQESHRFSQVVSGNQISNESPSASVMDYLEMPADTIMGVVINQKPEALSYDQFAIKQLYGYGDKTREMVQPGYFCSDEDVNQFADCSRFDAGKSPAEFAYVKTKERWREIPEEFLRSFHIAWNRFGKEFNFQLKDIGYLPLQAVHNALTPLDGFFWQLFEQKQQIRVRSQRKDLPEKSLDALEDKQTAEDLKQLKTTVAELILWMPKDIEKDLEEQFEKTLAKLNFETMGLGKEEIKRAREMFLMAFLPGIRQALYGRLVVMLSPSNYAIEGQEMKWRGGAYFLPTLNSLEDAMLEITKEILFSTKGAEAGYIYENPNLTNLTIAAGAEARDIYDNPNLTNLTIAEGAEARDIYDNPNLTNLTIAAGAKTSSIYNNPNLTNLTIAEGAEAGSIYDNPNLTNLTIAEGAKTWSIYGNPNLTSLTIAEGAIVGG